MSISKRKPASTPRLAVVPASLLKNIRGIAALKCYDFILEDNSLTTQMRQEKIFNFYHGNTEQNVLSQIDLLLKADGDYARLYDEEVKIITDTGATVRNNVLKDRFIGLSTQRFTANVQITRDNLVSPTRNKPEEKASARYIIDLAKLCIKNIKKASVTADEWLNEGELPSGQTWDDLYSHILESHQASRDGCFTGFMGFVCLTKYNSGGENNLASIAIDDTENDCSDNGRDESRKRAKTSKDDLRSIDATDKVYPLKARGLSIEQMMGVVELAQLEDHAWKDDIQSTILNLNNNRNALLMERSQSIDLAKCICPVFDDKNEFWNNVMKLSTDINNVKTQIDKTEENRNSLLSVKSENSSVVTNFITRLEVEKKNCEFKAL